ncbi:TonB-dependent receptor [Novosphingobium sp. SG720]|uniref:TonB-dependent receptor n=1 Tax=Novosphingobium sp. SG720 TaxID=2586998 RepID=UPI001447B409|nr:TonB-dependent receptor [Novosphingobium sp. SG720]NKJ44631.1 iron complex outermembrane receptor protein [Novosphingobium sp. SG720]
MRLGFHLLAGAALLYAPGVWAQDAQVSAGSGGASAAGDIIVTAQRHSESVQKAAVAITAFSGGDLLNQARNSVADAIATVPSVQVQGNANGAQIYIRGVGSNADAQLGDPAVNLNVDGVYQQQTEVPTSLMFDVNRVEVLRGPQGTLYGRNATAGAVNIVTNDPVLGRFEGYATAQVGNYDAVHAEGAINAPIGEDTAVRAAIATENHSGYLSNGNNDARMTAGRLKLLTKPTDSLRILIAGDYLHSGGHDVGSVEAPLSSHGDAWYSDKPKGLLDIDSWNARAQIDYTTSIANLALLASHNDFSKNEANVLLSPTAVSVHREGRQNSVELRASSPDGSAIKWVTGLFYYHDQELRQVVDSPIDATAAAASNPELRTATAKSYAAFANVTVPLTRTLRLTGGLRYTRDSKDARFVYTDGSGASDAVASRAWNSLTYKAGVEADLAAASLLYAQVASGFKAGGFAQQFPAASYNPEKITSVEIGSKNRFFGNLLTLNLAAFHYSYRDYQAQYPDLVDGSFALVTANAATAKIYGAEAEASLRLSADDRLMVNATYLHTRFGAFRYTSLLAGSVDHTAEEMPNSPTAAFDVAYDHDFHLGNGGTVTFHANTHISSGYWTTVERSTDSYQGSFTRSDAFLRYDAGTKAWDVRAFVRNIESRAVRTLGASNPIDSVLLIAPPRTYGVAATVRF